MIVTAPHAPESAKLSAVMSEMATMGAPAIRVIVVDGEDWQAVEGSHRLAAAAALGLLPTFVHVNADDSATGHDMQDLPKSATWGDVLEYLRTGSIGPGYEF